MDDGEIVSFVIPPVCVRELHDEICVGFPIPSPEDSELDKLPDLTADVALADVIANPLVNGGHDDDSDK